MLNINLSEQTPVEVREAIMALRRSHVSRFPVDVMSRDEDPYLVMFSDTRFPASRLHMDHCLALLKFNDVDDQGRRDYKVVSRRISNEKYARHNHKHHTKTTTDLKKVVKMLRDYAIKPYTGAEIAEKYRGSSIEDDVETWKSAAHREFRDVVRDLSVTEIAEEIMHLQSVGVIFRSDKFRRIATDGLDKMAEANRRKAVKQVPLFVYIQPDNSILAVTNRADDKPDDTTTYPTFDAAPACIQQQIAMLRLTDGQTFIPEVGRRVADDVFHVLVNPDDLNTQNC